MPKVVVLATGGTIASVSRGEGGAVAERTADQLLADLTPDDVDVDAKDVMNLGSYLMTFASKRQLAEAVHKELERDDVDGVVITHGTDTIEETGILLEAVHRSPKPVVITGAQRAADHPAPDGPDNLARAVQVAASRSARERGVLLVFGDDIFTLPGTRKFHTIAAAPFATAGAGPVGHVLNGVVTFLHTPERADPLPMPTEAFDAVRVDMVACYPGADAALCRAAEAAGAQGVVLLGTGSGNGNHALVSWVEEAVARGVVVALSTRVAEGPVVPLYGNGGAVSLLDAGAVLVEDMPAAQARVLMALLLSRNEEVTADIFRRGSRDAPAAEKQVHN